MAPAKVARIAEADAVPFIDAPLWPPPLPVGLLYYINPLVRGWLAGGGSVTVQSCRKIGAAPEKVDTPPLIIQPFNSTPSLCLNYMIVEGNIRIYC